MRNQKLIFREEIVTFSRGQRMALHMEILFHVIYDLLALIPVVLVKYMDHNMERSRAEIPECCLWMCTCRRATQMYEEWPALQ